MLLDPVLSLNVKIVPPKLKVLFEPLPEKTLPPFPVIVMLLLKEVGRVKLTPTAGAKIKLFKLEKSPEIVPLNPKVTGVFGAVIWGVFKLNEAAE